MCQGSNSSIREMGWSAMRVRTSRRYAYGSQVRSGRRQSMPSSSIDNCARVSETLPLVACGHTKRPRSRRLANKQSPSPSNHNTLIKSPRRPRNTNTCPENGLRLQLCLHQPAQPREAAPQIGHPRGDPDARSRPAACSSPQALQHHTQRGGIGAAFNANVPMRKVDVNRAGRGTIASLALDSRRHAR
jgi:hypothetical protein